MPWLLALGLLVLLGSPLLTGFGWGLLERRHSHAVSLRPGWCHPLPVSAYATSLAPGGPPCPPGIDLTRDGLRERYVQLWLYAQAPPLAAARRVLLEDV